MKEAKLPANGAYPTEWSWGFITWYVYSVLFKYTVAGKKSQKTVTRVRENNGLEAMRQIWEMNEPIDLGEAAIRFHDISSQRRRRLLYIYIS